ncbi:hypothetical protein [Companilactobacillus allii]|nr:hypothetical protein [Companilactobacillus allii]
MFSVQKNVNLSIVLKPIDVRITLSIGQEGILELLNMGLVTSYK